MWTILHAAGFLDPPLACNYRRNFTFDAIFVYKVYIDFWKNTKEAFVNDKQILTECFKTFLNF